jgi:DNA-binding NtrC family response regulator
MLMPCEPSARAVIIVAKSGPRPGIENELRVRGITVQWARSIKAASGLLDGAANGTLVITELALRDGNWRDLVERVRHARKFIPVVLLSPTRSAKLWWDALECGVEDILQAPLSASLLCEYIKRSAKQRSERAAVPKRKT